MSRITNLCQWLLHQAFVWGGMGCFAFYVLVVQNLDRDGALFHCLAGAGWELKLATSLLLCIGLASLAAKLFQTIVQLGALDRCQLRPTPSGGQSVDDVDRLIGELDQAPRSMRGSYLLERLQNALLHVRLKGSADALEGDLHQLAERDRRQMAEGYASLRMTGVAIGALGMIGALVGAMVATTGWTAPAVDGALPGFGGGVHIALSAAAQALAASIALLLARFAVERTELRLLTAVDASVDRQLRGRFRQYGAASDPQLAAVKQMCEKLLDAVHAAVTRHDAAITKNLGAASRRWEDAASAAATLLNRTVGEALTIGLKAHAQAINDGVVKHTADLEGTLIRHAEILSEGIDHHTAALADALEHHAAVLTETEKTLAQESGRRLGETAATVGEAMLVATDRQEKLVQQSERLIRDMQLSLVESAGATVAQHEQLVRQSDVLLRVVEATGQVRKLEEALNSNLSSLAASHRFEETVVGLSAALQLLSANLGRPFSVRSDIGLDRDDTTSQAA